MSGWSPTFVTRAPGVKPASSRSGWVVTHSTWVAGTPYSCSSRPRCHMLDVIQNCGSPIRLPRKSAGEPMFELSANATHGWRKRRPMNTGSASKSRPCARACTYVAIDISAMSYLPAIIARLFSSTVAVVKVRSTPSAATVPARIGSVNADAIKLQENGIGQDFSFRVLSITAKPRRPIWRNS